MFYNRDEVKQLIRCLLCTNQGSDMVLGDQNTKIIIIIIKKKRSLSLRHSDEQDKEKHLKKNRIWSEML